MCRLFFVDLATRNGLTVQHSHLSTATASVEHDLSLLTNATYEVQSQAHPGRCVHVIRNPLSIVASAYFSHRYSHPTEYWPELAAQRDRLAGVSQADGMRATMDFLEAEAFGWNTVGPLYALSRWDFDDPTFEVLCMEDLVSDVVGHLMPRLEAGFETPLVAPRAADFTFEALSGGRSKGSENVRSHYRSGVVDSWRTDLPQDVIDRLCDTYRPLLQRFYPDTLLNAQGG
ncbi:sulfotransferase family protein [Pseudooctadecabacter jejudonensis]|nr:hypothetical protein [Pseudooctadecabacter jejudonensis]